MKKTALEFTNQAPTFSLIEGGATRPKNASAHPLSYAVIERYGQDWINEAEYLLQSPCTIAGKSDSIMRLLWWMRQNHLDECGTKEFRRFFAYIGNGHLTSGGRWGNPRLTKPASPRTIQYYFNYLRGFCRWLQSENVIDESPMTGLLVPRVERDPIQPFNTEQINALLAAAAQSVQPKRNEAILLFMLDTGVRASELCSLSYKDLELHGSYGQATVLGKGRKKRTLPFSRRAARAMWQYLRDSPRPEHSAVFLSDRGQGAGAPFTRSGLLQLFERLGAAAGIRGVRCSPHTMRHTFAINFLRAGGNTFTLQQILGHTALHMTMKYCAIAQADIENQHKMFSPADRLGK
jgi:site-specific recombinase XerD